MMTLLGLPLEVVQGPGYEGPSLAYVLVILAFVVIGSAVLLAREVAIEEAAKATAAPSITADDLITDAAFARLCESQEGGHGRFYYECPGCLAEVHHTDLESHARGCTALRELVTQRS